jgi:hypothetical protein
VGELYRSLHASVAPASAAANLGRRATLPTAKQQAKIENCVKALELGQAAGASATEGRDCGDRLEAEFRRFVHAVEVQAAQCHPDQEAAEPTTRPMRGCRENGCD